MSVLPADEFPRVFGGAAKPGFWYWLARALDTSFAVRSKRAMPAIALRRSRRDIERCRQLLRKGVRVRSCNAQPVHHGDPTMMHLSPTHFGATARAPAKLPERPGAGVLNGAIPLFFIGRNRNGFWLAREAQGRIGGIFLLKRSALRFAQKASAPTGRATMFLAEPFELDIWNCGNPLVGWLDAALGIFNRLIPAYPPPIPIEEKYRKRDWW